MVVQTQPHEEKARDEHLLPPIREIEAYRLAARRIVRDQKRARTDRLSALMRLVSKARAEAILPEWCQRAVWHESAGFIQGRRNSPPISTEPIEAAIRSLHAKGLIRCPTCRLVLPDERTLDRWRSQRLAEAFGPELAGTSARR